jgi:hypothetical protein
MEEKDNTKETQISLKLFSENPQLLDKILNGSISEDGKRRSLGTIEILNRMRGLKEYISKQLDSDFKNFHYPDLMNYMFFKLQIKDGIQYVTYSIELYTDEDWVKHEFNFNNREQPDKDSLRAGFVKVLADLKSFINFEKQFINSYVDNIEEYLKEVKGKTKYKKSSEYYTTLAKSLREYRDKLPDKKDLHLVTDFYISQLYANEKMPTATELNNRDSISERTWERRFTDKEFINMLVVKLKLEMESCQNYIYDVILGAYNHWNKKLIELLSQDKSENKGHVKQYNDNIGGVEFDYLEGNGKLRTVEKKFGDGGKKTPIRKVDTDENDEGYFDNNFNYDYTSFQKSKLRNNENDNSDSETNEISSSKQADINKKNLALYNETRARVVIPKYDEKIIDSYLSGVFSSSAKRREYKLTIQEILLKVKFEQKLTEGEEKLYKPYLISYEYEINKKEKTKTLKKFK